MGSRNKEYFCKDCSCKISRNSVSQCHNCERESRYKKYIADWLESKTIDSKSKPRGYIRRYIFERQDSKCSVCKCLPVWNNKELIFILDHIDGDSTNHSPDNLRLICPNCDTQLPTFKNKNKGKGRAYDREYKRKRVRVVNEASLEN